MPTYSAPDSLIEPDVPQRGATSLALLVLSIDGFSIELTEFVIDGLLTEDSDSLGTSVTCIGQRVSIYALYVVPGALILTPILMRSTLKNALIVQLAFFLTGNALSAWAPNYAVMLPDESSPCSLTAVSSGLAQF